MNLFGDLKKKTRKILKKADPSGGEKGTLFASKLARVEAKRAFLEKFSRGGT